MGVTLVVKLARRPFEKPVFVEKLPVFSIFLENQKGSDPTISYKNYRLIKGYNHAEFQKKSHGSDPKLGWHSLGEQRVLRRREAFELPLVPVGEGNHRATLLVRLFLVLVLLKH